ncbi:RNA polymerase sigma factor SigF [Tsukamurella sp. 8F]|uniref:RNA polymerase sigma factor SigF n=1 Tax=unclassified Tsukamurella TaxID=2633480 RepID=UPI0023B9676C|nr:MULTISPECIES: RNA polymerase sigma factor SigF [unclassified Tsukamurella]MDF0532103.1 RNA polymerase sigma factor SigF [Tsukamurella sp. 8J]MDF0589219.1 RNA polymerase sigma factor SigF [Tsukamurella sp. 8F]
MVATTGRGAGYDDDYSDVADRLRSAEGKSAPQRAAIRDEVILRCLPLAEHLARRFTGRGEQFDDLVQVARLGLVNAVDRFDADKGTDFVAFAVPTILGVLRRHFRDTGWSARVPRRLQELYLRVNNTLGEYSQELGRAPTTTEIAGRLGVPVDEVRQAMVAGNGYHATSFDTPTVEDGAPALIDTIGADDPGYELVTEFEALRPVVEQLDDRSRTILALRFQHSMTQTQIAAQLGISQMHVSRILSRTLATLRDGVRAD